MVNSCWITPEIRTYKDIKLNFGTEDYVKIKQPRKNRSTIARMRNGTFPLNIELGRYRGIPLESRLCITCDDNRVESEEHFLCECSAYHDLRRDLFSKVKNVTNLDLTLVAGVEKLTTLLSNKLTCKYVNEFINAALTIRN